MPHLVCDQKRIEDVDSTEPGDATVAYRRGLPRLRKTARGYLLILQEALLQPRLMAAVAGSGPGTGTQGALSSITISECSRIDS